RSARSVRKPRARSPTPRTGGSRSAVNTKRPWQTETRQSRQENRDEEDANERGSSQHQRAQIPQEARRHGAARNRERGARDGRGGPPQGRRAAAGESRRHDRRRRSRLRGRRRDRVLVRPRLPVELPPNPHSIFRYSSNAFFSSGLSRVPNSWPQRLFPELRSE